MRPTASKSMSTIARSTATSSVCARSSRTSTASSRRSKPSMASATDIATAEAKAPAKRAPEGAPAQAGATRFHWTPLSALTRRIVEVNVLPLALLAVGFLYLGKFEASLIGQQIESLQTQGEIFAAALSEGAVLDSTDEGEILLPD